MAIRHPEQDFGSVVAYIKSRTRAILIREKDRTGKKPKLPGGQIEVGEGARKTIVREVREEVGRRLRREDLRRHGAQVHRSGSLRHCYTVDVSEAWIDNCPEFGDENGKPVEILKVLRSKVLTYDLPPAHRELIAEIESRN